MIIWHNSGEPSEGDALARLETSDPYWWAEVGLTPADDALREGGVLLLSVAAGARHAGVAIVPEALGGRLLKNRQPLPAGLHTLLHQDRLELHGKTVWVAKNTMTEAFDYQPLDGEPKMFCARTKLPLKAGARVVRCPGADCRLLYLEEAWQLLTPCHGCGFDPKLGEWRPPAEVKQHNDLAQLLELANGGQTAA